MVFMASYVRRPAVAIVNVPTPSKQCAYTMNTVSSYFVTTISFLVVAIGWWAADAEICCNSSLVASGGGDVVASCQNKNQTFHMVEAIAGGTCDDNRTAVPVRKCCGLGQSYDLINRKCRRDGVDGYWNLQRMIQRLIHFSLAVDKVVMVGYNYYEQPLCDAGDMLVDVTNDVENLINVSSWVFYLPPGYCFDMTSSNELVALTCHAAAVVCCKSSLVASGGGDVVASCQNKNRTFHMVEAIGGGTCDDNQTAVPIRKCCPLGQSYHREWKLCLRAVDGDEHLRRMMQLLRHKALEWDIPLMVGYNYDGLRCDDPDELEDDFVFHLFLEERFKIKVPHCFDLTEDGELVVRKCRRSKHCLKNTCVRRCCKGDRMIVDGPNGPECTVNENPFRMVAYRTNRDGTPVYNLSSIRLPSEALSNSKVVPSYVEFICSHRDMLEYGFQLTENGSLYLTYENHLVPYTEYCVGYSQGIVTDTLVAYICDADTVFMDKRAARASSIHLFYWASYVASAVCLAFTLLVYNILPSLRNNRNYYVKCYMSHEFASYICVIAQMNMENKKGHTCVLFGYINLFVFLSTLCWLNVICFDIYWMIRYNISINRNTSTSVRTIMYHFYCLGLPSIFVCTGFYFEYSQDESLQSFAPNFEAYGCFYYNMSDIGGVIFILLPVFVILAVNSILFMVTTNHSSRIKSELNKFNQTDSRTENFLLHREKFAMSTKLFLVMGIPHFLTVLSIILQIEVAIRYIIFYAASSLQGVFICIIFVAKPQVIMELRKIFRSSMDHSEPLQMNDISGSHNSGTGQCS